MRKNYFFDQEGYHVATGPASLDPLETKKAKTNVWLTPPNSTPIEAPEAPEGQAAKWNGVSWVIETDTRVPFSHPDDGVGALPQEAVSLLSPEEVEQSDAMVQAMQAHQEKVDAAVERVRAAKAKGIKAADSPKLLEDVFTILGV